MNSVFVFISKYISPNYFLISRKSDRIQIISIAISHYCEFACWSLLLGNKKFDEHCYAPVQHLFPVLSVRIDKNGKKIVSQTSRTNSPKENVVKRGGTTSVPLAIFPDGSVLKDSWEIAASSGLPDISNELKIILDEELGPLARQLAYAKILSPKNKNIFQALCFEGQPWWWKLLWFLFLGSYIHKIMEKLFCTSDRNAVNIANEKMKTVSNKLETIIKNKKTIFLEGDTIGIADIALSSLFSPMVNAPSYRQGKFEHIFDLLFQQDVEARTDCEYWRGTLVGQYVLDIYKNHRNV
jgi:hypothetical protein